MTIEYTSAAATARLTANYNATSQAAGVSVNGAAAAGTLRIYTTGGSGSGTLLCSFPLPQPPMSLSGRVATLLGVPISATPVVNGTAAVAEFWDGSPAAVATALSVGTSGTDVIVASTSFSTSIPAQLTGATVTVP